MTFEGDRTAGILRDSKIMNRMILLSLLFTVYCLLFTVHCLPYHNFQYLRISHIHSL